MKKLASLPLVLIFLLTSCEVIDDLFNQLKNDPGCQLISTEWSIPNDPAKNLQDFTYNSDNQLTEVKVTQYDLDPVPYIIRYELSYSGKKIATVNHFTKFYTDPEEQQLSYAFFYEGDQIDSIYIKGYNAYANTNDFMLPVYENGKLTELKNYHIDANTGNPILHVTHLLVWTGDNISSIGTQYINGPMNWVEYAYDDKNTPLTSIGLAFAEYGSLTMLSKNNVVKITRPNPVSGGSTVIDIEIAYNDSDYPISTLELTDYTTYPTNYEYSCR